MRLLIFLFLIAIPIAEIAVFIQVGEEIGVWPTIGLCLATALAGSFLLRQQGLATLNSARIQLDQGKMPVGEMLHGLALMLAGALLLVPGFVTDTVGLLLFVPGVRRWLMGGLLAGLVKTGAVFTASAGFSGPGQRQGQGRPGGVIDGDYQDITPPNPDDITPGGTNPDSPWRQLPDDTNVPDDSDPRGEKK